MIEYEDLLGKPYEIFARGPDKFDCYGIIIEMYRRNGKVVPNYFSLTDEFEDISNEIVKQLASWRLITKEESTKTLIGYDNKEFYLKPNCGILLRVGKFGCHIGYVLDNKSFIHTWEKSGGALVERIDYWKNHIIGFYDYD